MEAKFYDLSSEPAPVNRRMYAAAKLPFLYLWISLTTIISPWLYALPLAFAAAAIICVMGSSSGAGWMQFLIDICQVGIVFTAYLGAFFAVIALFR